MIKLYIVLFFLSISLSLFSQPPPKKTNKIILFNSFSKDENYFEVARTLLANNFTIEYNDKELGFINSSYPSTRFTREAKLTIVVKAGEVIVTGKCKSFDSTGYYVELQNRVLYELTFNFMHELIMNIPHNTVNYKLSKDRGR